MREIVFDTETTGLDPLIGDRMVEIGCIELVNRVPTGRTFHAYFNPQRPMPAAAEQVHGLSDAFLADKKCFHEHVVDLLEFLGDCPLVAHNAQFDFGFLNWELKNIGYPEVHLDRMIQLDRAKVDPEYAEKHGLSSVKQAEKPLAIHWLVKARRYHGMKRPE